VAVLTDSAKIASAREAIASAASTPTPPSGAGFQPADSKSRSRAIPAPAIALLSSPDPRTTGALLAERFFDNPSNHLALIGVTGSNGKTTLVYLIQQLLTAARKRCGLISTVEIDTTARKSDAAMTTPAAVDLTDFGSLTLLQPLTHTFTISNSGIGDLTLTGAPLVAITGPNAGNFTLVANPTTPVLGSIVAKG